MVNPYNIFAGLLRQNLIPKEQIEEANTEIFDHYSQTNYHKLPEHKDIETLKANNFFETVFKIAIVDYGLNDFMWVNNKCDLIIFFIENSPVNIRTVKCVFEMAERTNPSQWLVKGLKSTFINFPQLKTQFHTIATTNGIKIPADFR